MTEFEPLIGAVTAGMTSLIGKIKTNGHALHRNLDLDLDLGESWELNQAVQHYVQHYAEKLGILRVTGRQDDHGVQADTLATAVHLFDASTQRSDRSPISLHEDFESRFEPHTGESRPGIEVANEFPYLMVLGEPRSGKSTFLRGIGLKALQRMAGATLPPPAPAMPHPPQEVYTYDCIPVMVELCQFDGGAVTVKSLIVEAFAACSFTQPQEFTELCLESGKLLILLDGLDEVTVAALHPVIADIKSLIDRYSKNRFIITCRTASYPFSHFRGLQTVAIAPFNDTQVEQFIQHWFRQQNGLKANLANACWEQLKRPEHEVARTFAQTPLLLTLLCIVYEELQGFPRQRHRLYGEILNVLLRKSLAAKHPPQIPLHQRLGIDLELALLAEIAYISFENNQLWLQKQSVLARIQHFQTTNENAPKLSPGKILRELEGQQGILIKHSQSAYAFAHLAFQEYLTAKYIVDNQKVDQLVRDRLTDKRWRGVFLLVAGLAAGKQGADNLLLAMEQQTQALITTAKLRSLVAWAAAVTHHELAIEGTVIAKRAVALSLLLALRLVLNPASSYANDASGQMLEAAQKLVYTLDATEALRHRLNLDLIFARARALAFAHTLEVEDECIDDRARNHLLAISMAMSLTQDLLQACQLMGVVDEDHIQTLIQQLEAWHQHNDPPEEGADGWTQKTRQIWFDAVQIQADSLSLAISETTALNHYLYATELVIGCKETSTRIAPQIWQLIEARLLSAQRLCNQ